MLTVQVKLNIDDVISSLRDLSEDELEKLRYALYDLEESQALENAITEGLNDVAAGRTHAHHAVMDEIKAKYNFRNA